MLPSGMMCQRRHASWPANGPSSSTMTRRWAGPWPMTLSSNSSTGLSQARQGGVSGPYHGTEGRKAPKRADHRPVPSRQDLARLHPRPQDRQGRQNGHQSALSLPSCQSGTGRGRRCLPWCRRLHGNADLPILGGPVRPGSLPISGLAHLPSSCAGRHARRVICRSKVRYPVGTVWPEQTRSEGLSGNSAVRSGGRGLIGPYLS